MSASAWRRLSALDLLAGVRVVRVKGDAGRRRQFRQRIAPDILAGRSRGWPVGLLILFIVLDRRGTACLRLPDLIQADGFRPRCRRREIDRTGNQREAQKASPAFGPIIAPASQDLHSAAVESGVHSVSIEFDLVQPVGAVRCFLHELGELRFDPGRWRLNRPGKSGSWS
jgi:hypothetical protein